MSRLLGIRKIVGQRIAQKRDQAGLTQEQVADRIALGRKHMPATSVAPLT